MLKIKINDHEFLYEEGTGPGWCECKFCVMLNSSFWEAFRGQGEPYTGDTPPDPED